MEADWSTVYLLDPPKMLNMKFYIHKLLLSEEKIKINWKTLSNYINVKFKYGHGVPTTQITSD